MIRCAIVGAAGYSGGELVSILAGHPEAEIVALFGSDKAASTPISHAHPRLRGVCELPINPISTEAIIQSGAEVAFLATPHQASHDLTPPLLDAGIKVFDLSAAFRFADASVYPRHYGFTHARPDLLKRAVYGLAELNTDALATADLVGVAGCYPTSAILPIAPLARAGAIDRTRRVIIDSISGISGAGRSPQLKTLFCEVSVMPYEVLKHRHAPEIESHSGAKVVFTPHIGPYDRGIVSTIHIELVKGWDAERVTSTLAEAYAGRPFVRLLPAGVWPSVAGVRSTNFCDISLGCSDEGHLVIASAIDNLIKGAAGQAVQCMNLRYARQETLGLLPDPAAKGVTA